MTRRRTIVTAVLGLLCLVLIEGVWVMRGRLELLQAECGALAHRCADMGEALGMLAARRVLFLETLDELRATAPAAIEEGALQAEARSVLQRNGVELLSTRAGGANVLPWEAQGDPGTLTLALRGGYYDVMQVFAGWRALPVRMTALTLNRSSSPPSGCVEANVALEVLQ